MGYSLLGVSPGASAEQIHRNFCALHEEEANTGQSRQLRRLEQAYDILIDPVKRRQYDDSNIPREWLPQKSVLWDTLETEFAEKAEQKKVARKHVERMQRQTIREICARGAAKSQLAGLHKVNSTGTLSLSELIEEKRLREQETSKAQRFHIQDVKLRGASRERHPTKKVQQLEPTPAEEQQRRRKQHLDAEIAKRVAEKKAEALAAERSTRNMIREVCARGRAQAPVANQVINTLKQRAEEDRLSPRLSPRASSSASKEPTASDRWRAPSVTITLTVENASYEKLMKNEPLRDAFLATVKRAISYEAGSEIQPEHVAVSLSRGSIIVYGAIITPKGVSAQAICTRLTSAPLFCRRVGTYLSALEGIDTVTTGHLQITECCISTTGTDDQSSCASSVVGEDGTDKIPEKRQDRPIPKRRPLSAPAKKKAEEAEARAQWAIVQHIQDSFSQMIKDDDKAGSSR